jgi:Domain of unknown function (DUF397)
LADVCSGAQSSAARGCSHGNFPLSKYLEYSVQSPAARLQWRTSSACATQNCVQVAATEDAMIAVRNSSDPDGAMVLYSSAEWSAFLAGAKNGEFDNLIG